MIGDPRPMDTAPTDGTTVFGLVGEYYRPVFFGLPRPGARKRRWLALEGDLTYREDGDPEVPPHLVVVEPVGWLPPRWMKADVSPDEVRSK